MCPGASCPWSAGLFVLVEALDGAGALRDIGTALTACATLRPFAGSLATSFGVAALGNIMNNLPSGLLMGTALQTLHVPDYMRHAVLIGTDLGPEPMSSDGACLQLGCCG